MPTKPSKTKPFCVGLCGPDGVGKSTTALNMVASFKTWGVVAKVMSFATPIYAIAEIVTGLKADELRRRKSEVLSVKTAPMPFLVGKTFRWLLRRIGSEAMRDGVDNNIWVEVVGRLIKESTEDVIIFDDCRFATEAAVCGYVVELRRKGAEYSKAHSSDCGLPDELVHLHAEINATPRHFAYEIAERVVGEIILKRKAAKPVTRKTLSRRADSWNKDRKRKVAAVAAKRSAK